MFQKDIASLLACQAQQRPDAPALLAPGRAPLSYAQLWSQADSLATAVAGVAEPGSRVAVALPNGPEMALACLGVAAAFPCVPLNPLDPAPQLVDRLRETRAQLLVLEVSAPEALRSAARSAGVPVLEVRALNDRPAGCLEVVTHAAARAGTRAATDAAGKPAAMRTRPETTCLVFQTSGTTAKPKVVPLSHANVVSVAMNVRDLYRLGPQDRCLNVMPMFHSHALIFAMLACLSGGGSIVCAPRFDPDAFFDWIADFEPTWYTAVPTIHQAFIQHAARYRERAPAHRFRFVCSGSASLSPATMVALEAAVQAPVIESYGLSETATIFASNPMPPGTRKLGSVGLPVASRIAILDEGGRLLERGCTGEIAAQGPGVMSGYDDAQQNADAFVDGWLRTGDQGYLDADGYLFITGRIKEIVNRGGAKISPREIDDALLACPGVAQAAAFGFAHATLGEDLAAAVVLKAGEQPDPQAIRAWLAARLADYKVPSRILFVQEIPKTPTGKIQRFALPARLLDPALSSPSVPVASSEDTSADNARPMQRPLSESEQLIAGIWCELLKVPAVGLEDNFFDLGGDSLLLAEVVARVRKRTGKKLHPTHLSLQTLEQAAFKLDGMQARLPVWRRLLALGRRATG